MATLGANVTTLADWAKMLDPEGRIDAVVELLSQRNAILEDMHWQEGNLPTGHQYTVRSGLPDVYWRLINRGVAGSKSEESQVTEGCGMLEAWSEVDKDLAELNGNTPAFRLKKGQAFVQAMNNEMASTVFYGNASTAPEEFTGLAIRYSDLSADNADNIIDMNGTQSDNSSIWLVVWGEDGISGIFPKGSKAGLMHEDLGLVTVQDALGIAGSRLRVYQDHWQWKCGVAVEDWRQAVRICNIDISNLVAKSSAADLIDGMIAAIHAVDDLSRGKACFYMNRTVMKMLDIQRRDDVIAGGGLDYNLVDGKQMLSFRGVPVKLCDALLETEAQVT